MTRRRATFLSWSMWVLGVAAMVAGAVITSRNPAILTTEPEESLLENLIWLSSFVGFGLVGALVVSKRPSNRIGWILSGITLSVGVMVLAPAYARYALVTAPGTIPLGHLAAWVSTWAVVVPATLAIALVLLYPAGSITTRTGRVVLFLLLSLAALDVVAFALRPGPVEGDTPPMNPLGISGADGVLNSVISTSGSLMALLLVIGVVDLFVRFRKSSGVERLQFRWFLLSFAAFPVLFLLSTFLEEEVIGVGGFDPTLIVFPLWGLGTATALAVAITRHGLYEINRIVSRTVTYTLVVGALAAVFFVAVTALTALLDAESDVVVAGSTLAVAALFTPVRRRVQGWVDRRFNRSRYNAQTVMDGFADTLRNEVDPAEVAEGWVSVVSSTMKPKVVGVWISQESRNDFGTVGG